MEIIVDHELPGRIRFRAPCPVPEADVFHHLGEALARAGLRFELAYDRRTRRFLVTFDPADPVRATLRAAAAAPPPASGAEAPDGDRWVRSAPDAVPPVETSNSVVGLILPKVVRHLVYRWLTPAPLAPFVAAYRAWPFLRAGARDLARGELSVAVLDAAALAASMVMRDYGTVSTVTFLLDLGETISEWTRMRSRRRLSELLTGPDQPVWVRRGGVEVQIPAAELAAGDHVVVRAGSRIPVDGVVREGLARVNQAVMTGEAHARTRRPGMSVLAGTVVEEGEIVVEAVHVGAGTRLAAITRLLDSSEEQKAEVANASERLARRAVPWTFGIAGAVLLLTGDWVRAASVLVVDYSCALKLATPLIIKSAMIEASGRGALVKSGRHLEALAHADTFVFDKTGTLTQARPKVVAIHPFSGATREQVLRDVACLEEHFPHPLATAIVQQAQAEGLLHEERHGTVEYELAHGIASTLDGVRVAVGSRHFLEAHEAVDVSAAAERAAEAAARGQLLLYFAAGGKLTGLFAIEDPLQPVAREVVRGLKALGVRRIILLTGDGMATARTVAQELEISEVHVEMLPDEKTRLVRDLRAAGNVVAMVGDGMNDSAALAYADVGISVSHGAEVAREACDVLLLDGKLEALPTAVDLSRRALAKVRRSFWATLGANSSFMALGLFGLAPAALLAVLHNAATVGLCAWALRPLLGEEEAGD